MANNRCEDLYKAEVLQICVNKIAKKKGISNSFREVILAAHQSGKGYMIQTISHLLFYSKKNYSQVENFQDRC